MVSKWYVITGAPCSGKTTVLECLNKMGYQTVPEAARVFVDEEIRKGRKNEEVKYDMLKFQRNVLIMKLNSEKKMPKDRIIFFDRGLPDSIAYFEHYNFNVNEVLRFCKEKSYRKVFLLERLPFEKDYARIENDDAAARLQELLRKAYSGLGYEIVEIPIMTVEERVKMILSNIGPQ
jgi:predicted ATPase